MMALRFHAAVLALAALSATAASAAGLSTERVASGLAAPMYVAAPVGDDRLFIVERAGRVRFLRNGGLSLFLDITDGRVRTGFERGLLGIAFPPDYAASGAFYVYYSTPHSAPGVDHRSRLSRFHRNAGDPDSADDDDETVLLEIDQPYGNHNGGTIAFGPDGMLYVGLGDGGLGNDPGNRAQDGQSLLGKMLRLDVGFSDHDDPYTVPTDNPFFGEEDPGGPVPDLIRDEIWALGLRNPFRFSFDRETGDLYIGDVGQDAREEIDIELAPDPASGLPEHSGGHNYGWRIMEGSICTPGISPPPEPPLCDDPELVLPVYEYPHVMFEPQCSVTGGVVYRGSLPSIRGRYFFADWCSNEIWSFAWQGESTIDPESVVDHTEELEPGGGLAIDTIAAFGEDGAGELYIVDAGGDLYRVIPEPSATLMQLAGGLGLAFLQRLRRRVSAALSAE